MQFDHAAILSTMKTISSTSIGYYQAYKYPVDLVIRNLQEHKDVIKHINQGTTMTRGMHQHLQTNNNAPSNVYVCNSFQQPIE